MDNKYTLGPWDVAIIKHTFAIHGPKTDDGVWLIGQTNSSGPIDKANANLISAAPEMLDVCRMVMEGRCHTAFCIELARAAVAKATSGHLA